MKDMYSRKFRNQELRKLLKWAIKKWIEKYGEDPSLPMLKQNLKIVWGEMELERLEQEQLEKDINMIIEEENETAN